MQIRHQLAKLTLVLGLLTILTNCGTYAYHDRGSGPLFDKVTIDTNDYRTTTRWSFLWGWVENEWTPIDCLEPSAAEEGQCEQYVQVCPGQHAGRVEVSRPWYMGLLSLVTLGIVNPARVTMYCSVEPDDFDDFEDPFAEPDGPPADTAAACASADPDECGSGGSS